MEPETSAEMPKYKCHKEVHALKIKDIQVNPDNSAVITPEDEGFASFPVAPDYVTKHNPQAGGYYVVYSDGYRSFSPASAFEEGYTRI